MKKILSFSATILFLVVLSGSARAESYTAYLSSAQEVPTNASTSTGSARVVVDAAGANVTFNVVFNGLTSAQILGHIHGPAAIGVNAGVLITFPVVGGTSGTISGTLPITPTQLANLRSGQCYVNIHSTNFSGGEIRGQLAKNRPVDYDGDGRTDFSVLRFPNVAPPAVAQITYWNLRSTAGSLAQDFGDANTDFPVPGDYDGDGKDDLALYRDGANAGDDSFYLVLRSSNNTLLAVRWGVSGDQACARDYDGDGITDMTVFRRGVLATDVAFWYIRQSGNSNIQRSEAWGLTGDAAGGSFGDTPAPGDYDGDGKFDLCVYRFGGSSPNNTYIIKNSSNGTTRFVQWGDFQSDYIVPGDYDGDGKTDFCAARTGVGTTPVSWQLLRSSDGGTSFRTFGISSDLPTQGDYDGDGRTDFSMYRRGAVATASSTFFFIGSLSNTAQQQIWGLRADFPTATFDAR